MSHSQNQKKEVQAPSMGKTKEGSTGPLHGQSPQKKEVQAPSMGNSEDFPLQTDDQDLQDNKTPIKST